MTTRSLPDRLDRLAQKWGDGPRETNLANTLREAAAELRKAWHMREFKDRRVAERRKPAPERDDDYIQRRVGERRGSYPASWPVDGDDPYVG